MPKKKITTRRRQKKGGVGSLQERRKLSNKLELQTSQLTDSDSVLPQGPLSAPPRLQQYRSPTPYYNKRSTTSILSVVPKTVPTPKRNSRVLDTSENKQQSYVFEHRVDDTISSLQSSRFPSIKSYSSTNAISNLPGDKSQGLRRLSQNNLSHYNGALHPFSQHTPPSNKDFLRKFATFPFKLMDKVQGVFSLKPNNNGIYIDNNDNSGKDDIHRSVNTSSFNPRQSIQPILQNNKHFNEYTDLLRKISQAKKNKSVTTEYLDKLQQQLEKVKSNLSSRRGGRKPSKKVTPKRKAQKKKDKTKNHKIKKLSRTRNKTCYE
jgi:hypothetical protein